MPRFDSTDPKYPRTWAEQSFEYKCMFAYHIVMMAMFATGLFAGAV